MIKILHVESARRMFVFWHAFQISGLDGVHLYIFPRYFFPIGISKFGL